MARDKPADWTGLWFVLGILGQLALCIGLVQVITGQVLGGEGFKAIFAGSLGSLIGLAIVAVAAQTVIEKAQESLRATLNLCAILLLLFCTSLFAWEIVWPMLRTDPGTSYSGDPKASYEVTYASGRTTVRSGAELGKDEWDWYVGLYVSSTITVGGASLLMLLKSVRRKNSKTTTPD